MRSYKVFSFLLAFLLTCNISSAQVDSAGRITSPVKWTFATKKVNEKEVILIFTARIDAGWKLYSQHISEGGPIPLSFEFKPSSAYSCDGKVLEEEPITKYEKVFDMKLSWFANKGIFRQKVKINSSSPFNITGSLEYMVCNDTMCLPPTVEDFSFTLHSAKGTVKLIPVK